MLLLIWKTPALDIAYITGYGSGYDGVEIGVTAQETGREILSYAQEVVDDKHLTVDTAAGTDAYDGYRDLGGNARGKIGRNLFEHYGEASRLLQ